MNQTIFSYSILTQTAIPLGLLCKVASFLSDLEKEYPRHNEWYRKVAELVKIKHGTREILVCHDNNQDILGVAILKNDNIQKKICTLRVHSDFQRRGIGGNLLVKSMEYLNTRAPLITVSSQKIDQFLPLFNRFGYKLKGVYENKYKEGETEYSFNGEIGDPILLTDDCMNSEHSLLDKNTILTQPHYSNCNGMLDSWKILGQEKIRSKFRDFLCRRLTEIDMLSPRLASRRTVNDCGS